MGSVDHYFHFLLGLLAPLVPRQQNEAANGRALLRSSGAFDDKLMELNFNNVTILPHREWDERRTSAGDEVDQIFGYDHPDHYDAAAFARLRRLTLKRLGVVQPDLNPRIMLINRGKSPEYYQSASLPVKGSANLRRSVPNMAEIAARLDLSGYQAEMVELEESTLRDQVLLFAAARTVIAQHGAALANIVWMAPGGLIVEILPPVGLFNNFFSALAEKCGQRYVAVQQFRPPWSGRSRSRRGRLARSRRGSGSGGTDRRCRLIKRRPVPQPIVTNQHHIPAYHTGRRRARAAQRHATGAYHNIIYHLQMHLPLI